jgi:hypothetical protein
MPLHARSAWERDVPCVSDIASGKDRGTLNMVSLCPAVLLEETMRPICLQHGAATKEGQWVRNETPRKYNNAPGTNGKRLRAAPHDTASPNVDDDDGGGGMGGGGGGDVKLIYQKREKKRKKKSTLQPQLVQLRQSHLIIINTYIPRILNTFSKLPASFNSFRRRCRCDRRVMTTTAVRGIPGIRETGPARARCIYKQRKKEKKEEGQKRTRKRGEERKSCEMSAVWRTGQCAYKKHK